MSIALRALFSRRTSEPSVINVGFERELYMVQLRRNTQARQRLPHRKQTPTNGSLSSADRLMITAVYQWQTATQTTTLADLQQPDGLGELDVSGLAGSVWFGLVRVGFGVQLGL